MHLICLPIRNRGDWTGGFARVRMGGTISPISGKGAGKGSVAGAISGSAVVPQACDPQEKRSGEEGQGLGQRRGLGRGSSLSRGR
jgi:hypothetical protein